MKIKIKKNKHYPFYLFCLPLPKLILKKKATHRQKYFKFTSDCIYDLKDEDQLDVNKLFGFSIGHHHDNSFRFGWRVNLSTKRIKIFAYEYHNGIRQKPKHLSDLDIDKWYKFSLIYNSEKQTTFYNVDDTFFWVSKFTLNKKSGFGYTLGPYFGGGG